MNKHKLFVGASVVSVLLFLTTGVGLAQGPNPPGGGRPITAVDAGTGLTGGGTSGDVTLAVANTYRLPQACVNGQTAKWNGTAWTCANDGLALPFVGSVAVDNADALWITNTGNGSAGWFTVNNPAATSPALGAINYGGGMAFRARNLGTGQGGFFWISNAANPSEALYVKTEGIGQAARFEITQPGNSSDAITVYDKGIGRAASFTIDNPNNGKPVVEVSTNGTGPLLWARTTGAGGKAIPTGKFEIDNPANTAAALQVVTNGHPPYGALLVANSGTGAAASIQTESPTNPSPALGVSSFGTGPAAAFFVDRPDNNSPVIRVGTKGTGPAIRTQTWGTGWSAEFIVEGPPATSGKGVYISVPPGNEGLNVASGTKNAVVATSNGARLLYTEESSQVWFTDYGFGRLENGRALVAIDPLFAETINLDEPYHVFVQAYGDAELYVASRTRSGFQVVARDGDPKAEFSYRLVAKRLGLEGRRLERAPWADDDPNLYPATSDKVR